ncbi:MAG: protein kinase [Candidatus Melainabacteria bacterium]|nr:protein kinase [Candidatus Melainabacteria bacterium]
MTAGNEKVGGEELQEKERIDDASVGNVPLECVAADAPSTSITGGVRGFSPFQPGEVVSGRYRIVGELGRGGMGTVYKVEQIFLQCTYALKLFDARHSSPSSLMRFQREAKAAHDLNHPNLVRVYDFGTLNDDTPYLVMDFVEGETLAHLIKARGRLSVQQALAIFLQVCDGLGHAHERGIVHRDLKPSNIMVQTSHTSDSVAEVKILDFGIAKILHECALESLPLTRTGEVFGSPLYMSPEQCYGRSVDQRSDIYSLGCSLFEALTGLPPFAGDSALSTMLKHQQEAPLSLRDTLLGEEFPESLELIIPRLLAKDPARRYQTVSAVRDDLLCVMDNRALSSPSACSTGAEKSAGPSGKVLTAALAAFLLLLLAAGLSLLPKRQKAAERQSLISIPPAKKEGEILAEIHATMPSAIDRYFAFSSMQECKKGSWQLTFPRQSIGWIWTRSDGYNRKIPAKGSVSFRSAQPLGFEPNIYGCMETNVFRAFRPDELYEVRLAHNNHAGDEFVRNLGRLSGLKHLNLDSTPVTDEGLSAIKDLPGLEELNVTETEVTPEGLLRLKRLNQLSCLEAGEIDNVSKVLRQMHDAPLRILRAQSTQLSDDDLQMIVAKFPRLTHLFIKHNKDVSDRGLAYLVGARHLVSLDVRFCSLSPGCIMHLKRMPSLRNLEVSLATWTKSEREELQRSLPGCTVSKDEQ